MKISKYLFQYNHDPQTSKRKIIILDGISDVIAILVVVASFFIMPLIVAGIIPVYLVSVAVKRLKKVIKSNCCCGYSKDKTVSRNCKN